MQRRDFLKGACKICLLGNAGATVINMSGCSPSIGNTISKPEIVDNNIQIPLTIFDTNPVQIISPKNYAYEVAVEKNKEGTYKALLLKCTHMANQLVPTGNGYNCNLHGSKFSKEGTILKGPAATPLQQLQTTITEKHLLIRLIR